MGQLVVDAINRVLDSSWRSLAWLVRGARWEVTASAWTTRVGPHTSTRSSAS